MATSVPEGAGCSRGSAIAAACSSVPCTPSYCHGPRATKVPASGRARSRIGGSPPYGAAGRVSRCAGRAAVALGAATTDGEAGTAVAVGATGAGMHAFVRPTTRVATIEKRTRLSIAYLLGSVIRVLGPNSYALAGFHHHHADHPVGLVLREVADERERAGLVERERRRLDAEGWQRDLIRTVPVHGLSTRAVTRVKSLVTAEPLVVDRVVVHQRECDRHAHRTVDLRL